MIKEKISQWLEVNEGLANEGDIDWLVDVVKRCFNDLQGWVEQLQTENAKLIEELDYLRKSMDSLGSHNLKQGMMLSQMGVEPEDLAKVSINKIKADAITNACIECEVTPQFGSDVMGTIRVADLLEHANKVEKGND